MPTAIVTGASSGIGKAIYEFIQDEYVDERFSRVIGVSKNGPDVTVDLTKEIQILQFASEIHDLTCLINCAGILRLDEWDKQSSWNETFAVNFWAPLLLCHLFEDQLKAAHGLVINVASVSGIMSDPDTPIYGASKAALISLTKSLAIRWAPDIRVNCISPGFTDTNLVPEPTPDFLIDRVPLGFEASAEMILPAVAMLIESAYSTGSNIVVDGGLACRVG